MRTTGRRQLYTWAVDMWGLGAVVHEILTAEIPFTEAPPYDYRLNLPIHDHADVQHDVADCDHAVHKHSIVYRWRSTIRLLRRTKTISGRQSARV